METIFEEGIEEKEKEKEKENEEKNVLEDEIEKKEIKEDENEERKEYEEELIKENKDEKEEEIKKEIEDKEEIKNEKEYEEENIEEDNFNKEIYEEKIEEEYIFDCSEIEKCSQCNEESISQNLCIKCNILKNYYPLNDISQTNNNKYIDCVNNITKPTNYYFNNENLDYEICYDSCATCVYKGDDDENNCPSCEENFIKKPDYENSTNCVTQCYYYYFYTKYNQYKCTALPE